MSQPPDGQFDTHAASPDEVAQALWLVLADEPDDTRAQRAVSLIAGESDFGRLEYLVVTNQGDQLVGAVFAQTMRGKTAVLWPPRMTVESEGVADALLMEVNRRLQAAGIRVAQALLNENATDDPPRLQRNGYADSIDLRYLTCELGQTPATTPDGPLKFTEFRADQRPRLAQLLEETYHGTRDVPALDGVREMDDVVDGYEGTGKFDPSHWFFVQSEGRDVGCLLLTEHDDQQWELIYMGLTPEARGHGWGQHIVRFAQWRTRESGRQRLVLAVDGANDPAIAIYSREGFNEFARRRVLMKVFR